MNDPLQMTLPQTQSSDFLVTIYTKFLEFLVTSPALGTLIIVMFFVVVFSAMLLAAVTIRAKHQADLTRGIEMTLAEMTTVIANMSDAINNVNAQLAAMQAILGERCVGHKLNISMLPKE